MRRKFVDERGKLFGVLSVVDFLVILVAVLLALAVYSRFFASSETTSRSVPDEPFTYQVKISQVRQFTVDALHVGDNLYTRDSLLYLGTIEDIEVSPSEVWCTTVDGTYVQSELPERYDMMITVAATGLVSNGRYMASRTYEICVNGDLGFYTKYVNTSGVVWSVG